MRFGVSWLKNESNQLSAERQNYLKRKKRNRNLVRVTQLGILVVLIALWEILADIGVIDSFTHNIAIDKANIR